MRQLLVYVGWAVAFVVLAVYLAYGYLNQPTYSVLSPPLPSSQPVASGSPRT